MSDASTPHQELLKWAKDDLAYIEEHTRERGQDHFCEDFGCSSVRPLCEGIISLVEQYERLTIAIEGERSGAKIDFQRAERLEDELLELKEQLETLQGNVEAARRELARASDVRASRMQIIGNADLILQGSESSVYAASNPARSSALTRPITTEDRGGVGYQTSNPHGEIRDASAPASGPKEGE